MLYVVATPIGNLGDISSRALEILSTCDLIAAEDTRHTQKLLTHFQIKKPLISYYEHNKASRGPLLLEKLRNGETIALVSDAGTPGISDPGADLIKAAAEEGIPVSMAPGPVAGIMALVLSGLSTDKFVFEGFIGTDHKRREEFARMITVEKRTVILYEAPHRLLKTLELLKEAIPDRQTAVCRELTKTYEEIRRGIPAEQLAYFTAQEPRGEFVIVIEGAQQQEAPCETVTPEAVYRKTESILKESAESGECKSKNDALKEAAKEFGISKNQAYALYEEIKKTRS